MKDPLSFDHFQSSLLCGCNTGLVPQQTHPKVMTGNGQLTRGAIHNTGIPRFTLLMLGLKKKKHGNKNPINRGYLVVLNGEENRIEL